MLDVLRAGLASASDVAISVSFLRCSGVSLFIDDLRKFSERGGRARILTSTYMSITQPEALRALQGIDGVRVRLHLAASNALPNTGFHAKFFVFDGDESECWVGSSNLSRGGLTANIEANLRHEAPSAVAEAVDTFERLWNRDDVLGLDDDVVGAYSRALLEAQLARQRIVQARVDLPGGKDTPEPNEAQNQALQALARLRKFGERRAVVVAAPGVGKTYLAAFDVAAQGARRALFVSHRLEHLTQARRTFDTVHRGRRSTGLVHSASDQWGADFVFATIQSAAGSLERCAASEFDYLVVDEFHHAAAPSYRKLLDALSPSFLLGLTATPERADGHDVVALCDYNIAYEIRLLEAIKNDWLMPFHYFGIADETVDYEPVPWRNGRFDPKALESALMLEDRVDHILSHAVEKGFDGPRRATAGFCAGVRHAKFMADAFRRRGLSAACLTGEDSLARREEVYARLQEPADPLEWLFVADLLNEGVDIPALNSLLFLRPTDSATVFLQQLGRGLRLHSGTEVLTVLDFVGRHRNAWLTLETLHDPRAVPGPATVTQLDLTPPHGCEVILDDLTVEILRKVKRHARTRKETCAEAYRELRRELGRPPFPVDLVGRTDVPELRDFRNAFGSWLELRREMEDAEEWEKSLGPEDPAFEFLAALERDWQKQRVYAYAVVWGLCHSPDDPERGYEEFFERFPRWKVEFKPLGETKVWSSVKKKLNTLVVNQSLIAPVLEAFPDLDTLLRHAEVRLQHTLESDFRTRHAGVLRTPQNLVLHQHYARPEIINHFGRQYDPAVHNKGVVTFGADDPYSDEMILITKLDTASAKSEFQYENSFSNDHTFHWQSQNRQRQDNEAGREILDQQDTNKRLHLFVQRRSHASPIYVGLVRATGVTGNAPMNVAFELETPLTTGACKALGLSF